MTRRRWHQVTARLSDRGGFRLRAPGLPPTRPPPQGGRRQEKALPPLWGRVGWGAARDSGVQGYHGRVFSHSLESGPGDALSLAQENGPASLRIPPKEPAEALGTFRIKDGFRLDLLAAEPLVTDPVAMAYDEDGRAYVVEMSDYPYTDKSTDKPFAERTTDQPLGRVRLLEDIDGDGMFDRSTIFADKLSWPTGIALWKGGVFVAGDARPLVPQGHRRRRPRRRTQEGVHGLPQVQRPGRDQQPAVGPRSQDLRRGESNGGAIRGGNDVGTAPVKMACNDFRFDPATEQFELISGGARFGNAFDDWGNRFLCNIRNPVRHVVLEDRYLARNPLLPAASLLDDVAEAGDTFPIFRISPPEPWRVLRAGGSRPTPRGRLRGARRWPRAILTVGQRPDHLPRRGLPARVTTARPSSARSPTT